MRPRSVAGAVVVAALCAGALGVSFAQRTSSWLVDVEPGSPGGAFGQLSEQLQAPQIGLLFHCSTGSPRDDLSVTIARRETTETALSVSIDGTTAATGMPEVTHDGLADGNDVLILYLPRGTMTSTIERLLAAKRSVHVDVAFADGKPLSGDFNLNEIQSGAEALLPVCRGA